MLRKAVVTIKGQLKWTSAIFMVVIPPPPPNTGPAATCACCKCHLTQDESSDESSASSASRVASPSSVSSRSSASRASKKSNPSKTSTVAEDTLSSHTTESFTRSVEASRLRPIPPRTLHDLIGQTTSASLADAELLESILTCLRNPVTPSQRDTARDTYLCMMKQNLANLATLEAAYRRPGEFGYGSSWDLAGLTPLETSTHILLIYPPIPWPNWTSPSPTMNMLKSAGIWDIYKHRNVSFLHLHNHKHPERTKGDFSSRLIPQPMEGVWPGDPKALITELERQATDMICARMSQTDRPYLLICMGASNAQWLDKCHGNATFEKALGYKYTLSKVKFPVSHTPWRELEVEILNPVSRNITASVVVIRLNAPAFVCHDINDKNDCLGKAARLDAALELVRAIYSVSATESSKNTFVSIVYEKLERLGLTRGQRFVRNLMH